MRLLSKTRYSCVYQSNDQRIHKSFTNIKTYKKEVEFLEHLQNFDTVVRLIGHTNNIVTLEYVPHCLEYLIVSKKLSSKNKIIILKQIANFIIDSHDIGIVHNDLKAKNIRICKDLQTVRIIDFDATVWHDNPWNDIKKFRFLIVQMLFNLDYQTSYKKYDEYVDDLEPKLFRTVDVREILSLLDELVFP